VEREHAEKAQDGEWQRNDAVDHASAGLEFTVRFGELIEFVEHR
jgi:hypothetical protein